MTRYIVALLILVTPSLLCRGEDATPYVAIGQPSIFWRGGEWQIFQDGQWVPYLSISNGVSSTTEELNPEPIAPPPEPEVVVTNTYIMNYGWGYSFPLFGKPHRHHPVKTRHWSGRKQDNCPDQTETGLGQTTIGIGRQSGGLGQSTMGIGQRNGLGQTTIGIGQQSGGIGQTTIGIGQPNFQMGQRNVAMGQPNTRPGQTTVAIGQPNTAIGKPTAAIGQPTIGIGQQSSSIGSAREAQGAHGHQGASHTWGVRR